jgi:C-terminal processing protease CtpA/Prc
VYALVREAERQKETFLYNVDGDGVAYLGLPSFSVDPDFLGRVVGKVKRSRATVVDLRGNLGGARDSVVHFTGYFSDKADTIAEVVGRSKTEPLAVKPRQPRLTGPLVVLVDSQSASASEVFARHVQRTGRGVVIGDRTAGRATLAQFVSMSHGVDTVMFYGVEVAVGRIVFPGNEELEGRGVTPNGSCVPTSEDQREGRDPCLGLAMSEARKALGVSETSGNP